MDKGNMPDGLAAVWLNGRGDIGDERHLFLLFLAAVMFFFLSYLLLASAIFSYNCLSYVSYFYSIFLKDMDTINRIYQVSSILLLEVLCWLW
jgi:hypothetical protein